MESSISRSIKSMEQVMTGKKETLWLVIDKRLGCLLTTTNPGEASPMYEVADWVQWLTNSEKDSSNAEVKRLHALFQKMWESYISEITVSK